MVRLLSTNVGMVSTIGVRRVRDLGRSMGNVTNVRIGRQVPSGILRSTSRIMGVSLATRRLVGQLGTKGVCHPRGVRLTLGGFFGARGVLRLHRLTLGRITFQIRGGIRGRVIANRGNVQRRGFLTYVDDGRQAPQRVVHGTTQLTSQCGAIFFTLCMRAPTRDARHVPLTARQRLLGRFGLIARLNNRIVRISSSSVVKRVVGAYHRHKVAAIYVKRPTFGVPNTLFDLSGCQGFLRSLTRVSVSLVVLTWGVGIVGVGSGLALTVKVLITVVMLLIMLSIIGLRVLATARPSDPTTNPKLRQTLL